MPVTEKNGLLDLALQQFGLTQKTSWRVRSAYYLETDEGPLFLKRWKFGEEDLRFIDSAHTHLIEKGFASVLPYLRTRDGSLCAQVERETFVLTRWVTARESDYSNPSDLKKATELLAELHLAARGFRPGSPDRRIELGNWPETFAHRLREMDLFGNVATGRPRPTTFDRKYRAGTDYFLDQGRRAIRMIEASPYARLVEEAKKSGGLCHHDYAHHNVLLTDEGRVYLVDWDYSICDLRIHDLASLIIRNIKSSNWDQDLAESILETYHRRFPLEPDELKVMAAFLTWPQDYWQIGVQYYLEDKLWTEKGFHRRLDRNFANQQVREEFLEWFYRMAGW
jgi:CotS family spore coat protein